MSEDIPKNGESLRILPVSESDSILRILNFYDRVMSEDQAVALFLDAVRDFCEICGEIETPCDRMLRELGARGVDALTQLLAAQVETDDECLALFSVRLLISSNDPRSVDLVLDAMRLPFAKNWVRDEFLEHVFDEAVCDRFLDDPHFLAAAQELSKTWSNFCLDQYLRIAGERSRIDP